MSKAPARSICAAGSISRTLLIRVSTMTQPKT
jgi:hypothetical protein